MNFGEVPKKCCANFEIILEIFWNKFCFDNFQVSFEITYEKLQRKIK